MGKGKGHIPIRTCISCGAKGRKSELIRLLSDEDGQLMEDVRGKGQGRGAYICKSESCLNQLSKRKRRGKDLGMRRP